MRTVKVRLIMRTVQENCGYVTQKCDLLPGLSVYQTLRYAANLTIGRKVKEYEYTYFVFSFLHRRNVVELF